MVSKNSLSKRIIALLLTAVLMIVSFPLSGVMFAFAADDGFAFEVKCGEAAIENAKVTVSATSGENIITENAEYTSDKAGLVRVPEIDEYLANDADAKINIVFSVSADGYYDAESSRTATVTAENVKENVPVSMVANPTVNYTVNNESEAKVSVYYKNAAGENENFKSGTSLPVGTKVYVSAPSVNNYLINLSEGYTLDELTKLPVYTLTEKGLNIEVNYTPIEYTVTVNINDENYGKVDPNPIKIVKTEEKTDVTITPNEGYLIAEVKLNDTVLTPSEGKYEISNSEITDDKSVLYVTFAVKMYTVKVPECVTIDGEYDKTEDKEAKTVTYTGIQYGTTLNFKVNTPKDEYISAIEMDGAQIDIGQAVVENSFSREIKNIKTDIEFKVHFDTINIEKYKDTKYEDIYSVKNGKNEVKPTDGVYYVKGGYEVTLDYKNPNKDIKNYDVCSEKNKRNKTNGDITNWFNKKAPYKTGVSDNIQPLQLIETDNKRYFVPGTIKIRVDNKAPDIKVDKYNPGWTNASQTITFSVTDPTEKYNNEDYASGVKSVTVNGTTITPVDGKYTFETTPKANSQYDDVYKIVATDNVGNSSEETITIKTDTQAPVLDGKDGKDGNIEFKVNNTNIFERVINSVLYGKWVEKKFKATLTANDQDGVGFGNEKSSATLILKDAGGNEKYTFTADINEKGKAEFKEELPADWETFKGTIEYTLSDNLGNTSTSTLVNTNISNIGEDDIFSSVMIENNAPFISDISAESKADIKAKYDVTDGTIFNGDIEFTVDINDTESGLYSVAVIINDKIKCNVYDNGSETPYNGVHVFSQSAADTERHKLKFSTEGIVPTEIEIKNENENENGEVTKPKFGYKVDITVCDNAGNVSTQTRTVYKDTTAPVISGFDFTVSESGKGTIFPEKNGTTKLYEVVSATDYGFFFKETVTVKVKAQDDANAKNGEVASGVKAIVACAKDINGNVYYVNNSENYRLPITNEEHKEIFDKENCLIPVDGDNQISFNIPANFKGQIYAYAIDNVENKGDEVHPNGAVIENADKHMDTSSIEITMPETSYSQAYSNSFTDESRQLDSTPDYDTAKNVPLYSGSFNDNDGFNVNVTVKDTYSGIKSVECVLKENGNDTTVASYPSDSDNVDNWTVTSDPVDKTLVTEVSNKEITINGNHNDMVLEVILTDNAGNVSYDYVMFGIDKTAPVINVAYDNNDGDVKSNNGSTYFNADRTATVTISERNFDPSKVVFTIANAEGNAPEAVRIDEINDSIESTDETQHTYQITYSGEGVYTFDVKCTDRAENGNAEVNYGESVAPTAFVLDKTAPTISVSYDNNSAANGKFFNAHRTATIVVNEHNFDVNRVVINGTASLNGVAKAFPAAAWTSDGDVHTATISYNEDADYTFAISMDDMAGNAITDASVNYGASVAAKEFTVDTEIAKPVISNPTNGKPYQQEVPVSISSTDVNLENCVATLLKTGREKDENDNWKWVKDFRIDNVINLSNDGQTSSFSINDLFEHERLNDGIYTLKIDVADKAGNTQSETVTFTVNRFGSVYDYNQYTTETLNGKYVQAITDNIVITEYNPSPLSENAVVSLTRDGAPVEIGDSNLVITPVYTVSAAGASGWYEYKYEISKNVFSTVDAQGNMKYLDGIYKLYVASKDIANNDSENISAGADMSFSLDSTAPMIASITGLEKKTVNDVTKDVTFEIFDAIGLDTVEVTYVGVNGKTTETYNISDLLKSYDPATQTEKPDITKYDGSFTMGEGMNNIVRIVAKDLAGNVMDTGDPNVENSAINFDASVLAFNSLITVSTNPFVRWYSHTVFFWVSIAVIAVVLGAGGYLAAVKLRKKEEKETEDYKNSKKNNK